MRRGRRILEELDRDIREHIERETQDNIERGMTPEEARYAAVRKFGNVMRVKEDTRDVWRIAWIEELWQDIRYGLRMLRNSPGFAAVAVLTLALGIGANTAIFSLIDAVMLRSLPVEKPSELVVLRWSARKAPRINGYMSSGDCPSNLRFGAANPSGCSFSEPMFREIRNTNQFSGVAAFANAGPLALTGNGPASMISGQLVSGDFFNTLGLRAAAGRVLELSDDSPTAAPVAVLNYGHWQSSFGGARDAVGRTIELNGVAFTIVGVVEQRFTGITPGSDYDVWLPLAAGLRISDPRMWDNRQDKVTFWWLTILGRLKAERPILQAQAAISGIFRNAVRGGRNAGPSRTARWRRACVETSSYRRPGACRRESCAATTSRGFAKLCSSWRRHASGRGGPGICQGSGPVRAGCTRSSASRYAERAKDLLEA